MSYSNTPNTGDTLGSTKVPINTNFRLIQAAMSQDHYGMGTGATTAGKHTIIHIVEQATEGQTAATETAVYNKSGGTGDLFVRSPNHVDPLPAGEYQLTTFKDANIANFGTNILVGSDNSGWTFLPGGLVLMYGLEGFSTNDTHTITFPVTLNVATFTPVITTGTFIPTLISVGIPTNTDFTITNGFAGINNVKWMCIGKP